MSLPYSSATSGQNAIKDIQSMLRAVDKNGEFDVFRKIYMEQKSE